jgi:cytochrome P450
MLFQKVNEVLGPEDPEYRGDSSAGETAANAWRTAAEYCTELGLSRRGKEGDDFLTLIANAKVLDRFLTPEQVGYNVWNFVIGGLDTTRNAIASGMLALIQNPAQAHRLREDKSLIPTAVDEILRWTSPITHSMRVAVKDTEIGGRGIAAGDWVVVWNMSANRDESVFDYPDSFDVGRRPNDHFAFAYGEHFCIGAHLARLDSPGSGGTDRAHARAGPGRRSGSPGIGCPGGHQAAADQVSAAARFGRLMGKTREKED